jgi:hypothetical protein
MTRRSKTHGRFLPAGDGWQMQYRRMLRSRAKFDVSYSSTEEYDDAVYHFFQDAWHLNDWLRSDPNVLEVVKQEVRRHITAPNMLAVQDVANGSKHLGRDRQRPGGTTLVERKLAVRAFRIGVVGTESGVTHTHTLKLESGATVTAAELADQVISEWDAFLERCRLLPL